MQLLRQLLLAFTLLQAATAVSANSLSVCGKKDDPVTCYLGIAVEQMTRISDSGEKAEALIYLLHSHARVTRANPLLIDQAIKLLRSKKELSVGNRLDLLLHLYEYSRIYHPQISEKYYRVLIQTINLYAEDNNLSSKADFTLWACNLFEEDKEIWNAFSHVFLDHCRKGIFDELAKDNSERNVLSHIGKVSFSFAYGDFPSVDDSLAALSERVNQLVQESRNNRKRTGELQLLERNMQLFVHIVRASAAMHLRKYDYVATEIAATRQIYRDLDVTNPKNLEELLNSRITIAKLYSQWGDYSRALGQLNELRGAIDKNLGNSQFIKRNTLVEFLTVYAISTYHLGFEKTGFVEEVWADQSLRVADVSYKAGKRLLSGKSSQRGIEVGLQFLSRAASSGHMLALHDMGVIFRDAEYGVKQDFRRAFEMFALSANRGFAGAQNNLGDLYENGFGVEKSYGDAIYWYSQAAQQGEPTAYLSLGTLFAKGIGVRKDNHRAAFWLTLAAQYLSDGNNKKDALNQLAEILPLMTAEEKNRIKRQADRFRPLKQETSLLSDSKAKD